MFSSTVKLGNRVVIWNVRASPSAARRKGGSGVISWPKRKMRPALGDSCPPIRLNSVVLPAPLGPRMTRRSPGWTSRDRLCRACNPPKFLPSLSMTRAVTALSSGGTEGRASAQLGVGDLGLLKRPREITRHGLDVGTHRVAHVAREVHAYHTGLLNHQKVEVCSALNAFPKGVGGDEPQRVNPCRWLECQPHAVLGQKFTEQM